MCSGVCVVLLWLWAKPSAAWGVEPSHKTLTVPNILDKSLEHVTFNDAPYFKELLGARKSQGPTNTVGPIM